MSEKKTPKWLLLGDGSVTIIFTKPETLNGVKVDRITLRAPTVRDVRSAQKLHPTDNEERELVLFASLGQVPPTDLDGLQLKNYNRVQEGYFRVLSDDDDDATGAAQSGEAIGS